MGSGCFPIHITSKESVKLVQAKQLLKEFAEEWAEGVSSGDSGGGQFDNAASDGGYLERIYIAMEMIDAVLYIPKKEG